MRTGAATFPRTKHSEECKKYQKSPDNTGADDGRCHLPDRQRSTPRERERETETETESERERERERDARCAPLSSPDPRGASSLIEVSPGQASAYSPCGRRTSGEWNSGERVIPTRARESIACGDRRTSARAVFARTCVRSSTHVLRVRGRTTRIGAWLTRLCRIDLFSPAINSIIL